MASRKRNPPRAGETSHDDVGFWSEIKLDILAKYWPAYTRIVKKRFYTLYIDAFAGSGTHVSRTTGDFIRGSPARALDVKPPFDEYHFVDLDAAKVTSLEELAAARANVTVHHGDCNSILLDELFPHVRYDYFRRAICLLDPYSLQLDWSIIERASAMTTIEIFLNFPILDINRNVLRKNPSDRKTEQMTRFWGDESWRDAAVKKEKMLFDLTDDVKVENWELVEAFRERLRKVAEFTFVPEPMAMRNRQRAAVYYLFFAGNNETGATIVTDIFNGYRDKGYG